MLMRTVSHVDVTVTGPALTETVTSQRGAGGGGASEDVDCRVGERAERHPQGHRRAQGRGCQARSGTEEGAAGRGAARARASRAGCTTWRGHPPPVPVPQLRLHPHGRSSKALKWAAWRMRARSG